MGVIKSVLRWLIFKMHWCSMLSPEEHDIIGRRLYAIINTIGLFFWLGIIGFFITGLGDNLFLNRLFYFFLYICMVYGWPIGFFIGTIYYVRYKLYHHVVLNTIFFAFVYYFVVKLFFKLLIEFRNSARYFLSITFVNNLEQLL